MADFTTFAVVDPNLRFAVSSGRIDFTAMHSDEAAYVYKDLGVGFYNADYSFDLEVNCFASSGSSALAAPWCLANTLGDLNGLVSNDYHALSMNAATPILYLRENVGGSEQVASYALTHHRPYFLRVRRDILVGTYGTLYCEIYSDPDRTDLLTTLSLTLTAFKSFRYLYGIQSANYSIADTISGYVKNSSADGGPPPTSATTINISATLPPVTGSFNVRIIAVAATLAAVTGSMDVTACPSTAIAATLAPLTGYAAIQRTGLSATLAAITGSMTVHPGTGIAIRSTLAPVTGKITGTVASSAVVNASVPAITGKLYVNRQHRFLFRGALAPITGGCTVQAQGAVVIAGTLPAVTGRMFITSTVTEAFTAFCVNTKTTGVARYENFPFRSLFRQGNRCFGANGDGIFELTGKTDDGDQIDAFVETGVSNCGTEMEKFFPDAYLSLRCTGQMLLTVTVDETKARNYPIEQWEGKEGIHKKRRKLAQGIKGGYVQLKIANVDGCDFTLAETNLITAPSTTRRSE